MKPALFLDFDGTLVDIAARPEAVVVDPDLVAALARLRDRLDGALAIVSGRAIAVLDDFLRPERFDAAGLHGLERRIGERLLPCRAEDHPRLRREIEVLKAAAPTALLIEDKGCSVAIHWRTTPELAPIATALVGRASAALGENYRVQEGKAVLEIVPASAGKGGAIRALLGEPPFLGRSPVFIGDDHTDEHGFAAVNEAGGLSIKIGDGASIAHRRIASPAALREWLRNWAAGMEIPHG